MDDFLHNLRSGKLKQSDRGRRDYTDYKGPQRRAATDRRKTDYYAKVTNENFALIKETLDVLADCQKRIADAMVGREQTQIRIADALESIAMMMRGRADDAEPQAQTGDTRTQGDQTLPQENRSTAESAGDHPEGGYAGAGSQPDLVGMISRMRDQGDSWEKIARYFDEHKIPTVSGKGKWRGPAVKKYWEANA